MFAALGERLDDWLHEQNIRRIRLLRRLGLLPKPTPEQIARAAEWDRALSTMTRTQQLAAMGTWRTFDTITAPKTGQTVNFRKFEPLITTSMHKYGNDEDDDDDAPGGHCSSCA